MPFNLQDKVTVITGGGSGIGKAIATLFAQQQSKVCILDLNKASIDETINGLHGQHLSATGYECNVANQKEVNGRIDSIVNKFGRIDILVNCAGVAHVGKLENTSEHDFNRLFEINVKGTYHVMQAAIAQMKKQQSGVILNMASVAAFVGIADRFAYSMTKGAVVSMTLSVAKDYVNDGIRCNSISPGRVHTPFVDGFLKTNYPGKEKEMFEKLSKTQPIGRMGKPEEIAHLALYLCSDEASFATGTDYPIDGGSLKLNT